MAAQVKWPARFALLALAVLYCAAAPAEGDSGAASETGSPEGRLAAPPRPLGGRLPELDPALSPDGALLAYSSLDGGNWDIWIRDLSRGRAGDPPLRVTRHPAADRRPCWSPDGKHLVFVSSREEASGDIWRVRIRGRAGSLRAGKPKALLSRPGGQDHPALDSEGRLYWDEEDAGGRRVLRREGQDRIRVLAQPALKPRPAPGGLYILREGRPADAVADESASVAGYAKASDSVLAVLGDLRGAWSSGIAVAFLPDSLLAGAGPLPDFSPLWSPPGGSVDYAVDPRGGGVWLIGLERFRPAFPGSRPRVRAGCWRLGSGIRRILPAGRDPHQLSVGGGRMVVCEGRENPELLLEPDSGPVPRAPSAELQYSLWDGRSDDSLAVLILESLQADWPGSPEARDAALQEIRLRLRRGLEHPAELAEIAALKAEGMRDPERAARLRVLELALRMRAESAAEAREEQAGQLDALARYLLQRGQRGPAAEAWLELARAWLDRGSARLALPALLTLESSCRGEDETAEGVLLKVRAYEMQHQFQAALGALRELAERFPGRPELLRRWVDADLSRLRRVQGARGLLKVRERLGALSSIRALRMAYLLELARREAAMGEEHRDVALEDLAVVLALDPAGLDPFELAVLKEAQLLRARILLAENRSEEALVELKDLEELLADRGLRAELRAERVRLRRNRGDAAERTGDLELAAAEYGRALDLDPGHFPALRGLFRCLMQLGWLAEREAACRRAAEAPGAEARHCYALGLLISWLASEDPARLPESEYWLERSLTLDHRIVEAYLALGWTLAEQVRLMRRRPEGLKSLLRQFSESRVQFSRLRYGRAGLLDSRPGADELADRAIFLLQRGLDLLPPGGDPELAAALSQNLGNLFFSMGEFGAAAAAEAYLERLEHSERFRGEGERLVFLQCLGIAQQWSGELEPAVARLDSAQTLAGRLDRTENRVALLARLGMLAGERGEFGEALSWYRRALALEGDPGQRALLQRNRCLALMELDEDQQARHCLALAREELSRGSWPLPPDQNWLRLEILGFSLPLWNFRGLSTGSGRYEWRVEDERLLHNAVESELEGRLGREDLRIEGMNLRRRLLRKQGDQEGVVRLDLAVARRLAGRGRLLEAARRYRDAGRRAGEELLGIGVEGIACEGALSSLLLADRQRADTTGSRRKDELERRLAEQTAVLEGLLARAGQGELLPPRGRLSLLLLWAQLKERRAARSNPVRALLLRGEALLRLEGINLATHRDGRPVLPADRVSVLLARAGLHRGLGETRQARRLLEEAYACLGLLADRSPVEKEEVASPAFDSSSDPELLWRLDLLAAELLLDRGDEFETPGGMVLLAALRRDLEDLPAEPGRQLELRIRKRGLPLMAKLARRLESSAGTELQLEQELWRRWWLGRRQLETLELRLSRESWTNHWRNLVFDSRELFLTRRAALGAVPGTEDSLAGRGENLVRFVEQDRRALSETEARLRSLVEPGPLHPDSLALWTQNSETNLVEWEGRPPLTGEEAESGDRDPRRWCADPVQLRLAAANSALGGEWICLLSEDETPAEDPRLRRESPELLLRPGAQALEGRVLCLDAVLHLDRGFPLGSWFDFGRRRVDLASLLELDLPGEVLALRGLRMEGPPELGELEAWLLLERVLVLGGLQRAVMPLPDRELDRVALVDLGLGLLENDPVLERDPRFVFLGAPPLEPEARRLQAREGLERLVRLGNHYRRSGRQDLAWRAYRRGLDLALRLGNTTFSGRLMLLASRSAVESVDPGEALEVLLPLPAQLLEGSWDRPAVMRQLTLLADLAGEEELADSLWSLGVLLEPAATSEEQLAARQRYGRVPEELKALRPVDEKRARKMLDGRLATLKRRDRHVRAALLARRFAALPVDADPRRALFLAKLYLDANDLAGCLACFDGPLVQWDSLSGSPALDRLELEAVALQRSGDLRAAEGLFEQASQVLEEGSWPARRRALHQLRMGDLRWSQGLAARAFMRLDEARGFLGDEDADLRLLYENSSGLVRMELGELEEAAVHFMRAHELALRLELPVELAAVFNNLGRLALSRGRPQRALERFAEAARLDSLSGDRGRALVTLRNTAEAELSLAQGLRGAAGKRGLRRAGELLAGGLLDALELEDRRELSRLRELDARRLLQLGEAGKAERAAREAHRGAESGEFHRERRRAALSLARAQRAGGTSLEAEQLLREELELLQRELRRQSGVRFRRGGEAAEGLVDELVDLLAERGAAREALLVSEQGRALGFLELLRLRRSGYAVDPALKARRDSLAGLLTRSLAEDPPPRKRIRELQEALDRVLLNIESRAAAEDPGGTAQGPLPENLEQLDRLLLELGSEGAWIVYHVGERRSWCFHAGEQGLRATALNLPREDLSELLLSHRRRIIDLQSTEGSGRRLAEILLDPVFGAGGPPSRLVVVGHGALHHLPFATLVLEDGGLLVERCALVQAGSLSLLGRTIDRESPTGEGLVFADPLHPGTAQLDFAGLEAQSVAHSTRGVEVLSGALASEAALKEDRRARAFRHFSCHALHDPRGQVGSGLLLSPGEGEDGRLDAGEIVALDLPTGIVMLSACETGLGRIGPGDELAGLPRAFVAAGARSVISSLWKVEDLATAVLVKHFYRRLEAGADLDEALRLAQLAVRRYVHPHPAYWAAFTLSGNGRARDHVSD